MALMLLKISAITTLLKFCIHYLLSNHIRQFGFLLLILCCQLQLGLEDQFRCSRGRQKCLFGCRGWRSLVGAGRLKEADFGIKQIERVIIRNKKFTSTKCS